MLSNLPSARQGDPFHGNRQDACASIAATDTKRLLSQIQNVIDALDIKRQKRSEELTQKAKTTYARRVIQRVNKREPEGSGQRKRSKTGEIKVACLSNQRAKQSDPRLGWAMFHSITNMYREGRQRSATYFNQMVSSYRLKTQEKLLGPEIL